MKLETKKREGYTQLFFSTKIPFLPKTLRINTLLYNTPNTWVHGYSSRTLNGRYIILLDYDNLELEDLEEELKFLQKKHELGNFHIFKLDRQRSFHACCLDTFSFAETYEILQKTSADQAFIHSIKILRTREWVLRWGNKGQRNPPQYLKTIKSNNQKHEQSTAHGLLLDKLGAPIQPKKGKWDGIKHLGLIDYNTANRTGGI